MEQTEGSGQRSDEIEQTPCASANPTFSATTDNKNCGMSTQSQAQKNPDEVKDAAPEVVKVTQSECEEDKASSSRPISTCSIASTGSSIEKELQQTATPIPKQVLPPKIPVIPSVAPNRMAPAAPTSNSKTPSKQANMKRKVCELKCSEVRWFHRKEAETKWTPFKGYDSTVLELAYRKKKSLALDETLLSHMEELPQTEEVIVMNGLYQLNIEEGNGFSEISSIYWKEDTVRIRRGTWFASDVPLQPLPVELADVIEEHHLKSFRGQKIPDVPVFSDTELSKKPVLTSLKWNENEEVRWNSVIDVSISNQKKGNRLIRFVTRSKGTTYLKRGFNEETLFEDGKPEFSDLVLVVHGIGQKGYENLIAKNTSQIRDAIVHLMEKNYPDENRRPIILPIEWRCSLTLDDGVTDFVTLPRMSNVRTTLNSVAMDIMYYQSPLYRTEIVNGVIATLNSVYSIFMKNNPTFKGDVSMFAHSLGCVISYDILTNWSPFLLYDEFVTNAIKDHIKNSGETGKERDLMEEFYNSRKKLLEAGDVMKQILVRQDQQLQFKVKYLFCVGSPLAVFIIMRGADYKIILPEKQQVERIFNIFHPYDPVAYRLEPLFHENYRYIRPLKMLSYGDSKQPYDEMTYELHKSYLKKKKKEKHADKTDGKSTADDKKSDTNDSDSDDEDIMRMNAESPSSSKAPTQEEIAAIQREGDSGTNPNKSSSWWGFKSSSKDEKDDAMKIDSCKPAKTDTTPPRPPPPNINGIHSNLNKNGPVGHEPNEAELEHMKKRMGEASELIEEISIEKRLPIRLDYQLQPALTDKSYWSMFKSHFAYWTNPDVTNFVLNTLYADPEVKGEE